MEMQSLCQDWLRSHAPSPCLSAGLSHSLSAATDLKPMWRELVRLRLRKESLEPGLWL